MKASKVLFISQEIVPFTESSEIAENSKNLPQAIQERGNEIRLFMPKWGSINERRNQLHEVQRLSGMNIIIDDTDHPLIIKVASLPVTRMQVFFLNNDDYFRNHLNTRDENGVEYADNDERNIFYARGVLETIKKQRWSPEIIHCHGWIAALVGLYIKTFYKDEPVFRDTKVIYSLYDDTFNNSFGENYLKKLMIKNMESVDFSDIQTPVNHTELTKIAIKWADGIIINSKNINPELIQFAQSANKPILEYQSSDMYAEACTKFYDQIFDNEENEDEA